MVKNLPANAGDASLIPVGKILWSRKWQHMPVFLPGKSHGQRSLKGYSPQGCKRVRHNLMTKQELQQQMLNMFSYQSQSIRENTSYWVQKQFSGAQLIVMPDSNLQVVMWEDSGVPGHGAAVAVAMREVSGLSVGVCIKH